MIIGDLKYAIKSTIKSMIICVLLLAVPVVVTLIAGGAFGKLHNVVAVWPKELMAVCGVTNMYYKAPAIMPFYMILILINIFAMCICAASTMNIMSKDEESGMIQFYVNQPFSRSQIYIIKVVGIALTAVVQWVLYGLFIKLAVKIICSMRNLPYEQERQGINDIMIRGVVILLFLVSIGIIYNMNSRRTMTMGSLFSIICSFSYIIGNLYKVFDLIGYYMRMALVDDSVIAKLTEALEKLRIFFPFTLLNVLNTEKKPLPEERYIWYVMISCVFVLLGWLMYRKKSFVD